MTPPHGMFFSEASQLLNTAHSTRAFSVQSSAPLSTTLTSSVMNQYGRQIRDTVMETLDRLGVDSVKINVVDKGALDCTLKARVECAVFRSCDASEKDIPWGGVIQ